MRVQAIPAYNQQFRGWNPATKSQDITKLTECYKKAAEQFPDAKFRYTKEEVAELFKWLDTKTPFHTIHFEEAPKQKAGIYGNLVAESLENGHSTKIIAPLTEIRSFGGETYFIEGFRSLKSQIEKAMESMT